MTLGLLETLLVSVHLFPPTASMRLPGPPPRAVAGDRVERLLAAALVATVATQFLLVIAGWLVD